MEIHQYWTAPRQTHRMTTPSFAEKWRLLYNHWRKGNSAGVDNIPAEECPSRWRGCNHRSHDNLQQDLADRRMANPMDPVLNHHTSQEKATCSSARTTQQSASSVTQVMSHSTVKKKKGGRRWVFFYFFLRSSSSRWALIGTLWWARIGYNMWWEVSGWWWVYWLCRPQDGWLNTSVVSAWMWDSFC